MPEILVSIITPAWKAARFIEETIRSVQHQDYQNWEMLIVDDCSPDDTAARVEAISSVDKRVKLIRQLKNGGPALARNAGLNAAQGSFVAFLDSDDVWLPNKLSRQLAFMAERQSVFSFTQFRRIPEVGGSAGKLVNVPPSLNYRQLLCNTAIATSTVIINRGVTGDFRMKQTYYDDFAAWLEILKRGFSAHGLSEDLMRYRVVGKSVSRNKGKSAAMVWRVYRDIEKLTVIDSAWCFLNYGIRGWLKYRQF